MNHREIEKILKALGNRRRLAILRLLREDEEVKVGNIALEIGLSFRSTSRHIIVLEKANILEKDQRGLEVFCCLSDKIPQFALNIIGEL
ncbi:MAG: helix-turn-helix transcriptional regulator [Minisyncoccia bacterium]|jgi:DNA-binding transcriptional ArsR family regulator